MTFGDLPIRTKLRALMMLASGAALLVASIAFVTHEVLTFRNTELAELEALAMVTGENVVAPLAFDDADAAVATLRSLARSSSVVTATLSTPAGDEFAEYVRDGSRPVDSAIRAEGRRALLDSGAPARFVERRQIGRAHV